MQLSAGQFSDEIRSGFGPCLNVRLGASILRMMKLSDELAKQTAERQWPSIAVQDSTCLRDLLAHLDRFCQPHVAHDAANVATKFQRNAKTVYFG